MNYIKSSLGLRLRGEIVKRKYEILLWTAFAIAVFALIFVTSEKDVCSHVAVYDKTTGTYLPKCEYSNDIPFGNPVVRHISNIPCWYGTKNCIVTVVGLNSNFDVQYRA